MNIPGGEVLNDSAISNVDTVPVITAAKPIDIPGGSVLKDSPSSQSGVASTPSGSDTASVEATAPKKAAGPVADPDPLESSAEALESLLAKADETAHAEPTAHNAARPTDDDGPITRSRTHGTAAVDTKALSLNAETPTLMTGGAKRTNTDDEFAELQGLTAEAAPPAAAPKRGLPDEAALRRAFDRAFDEAREAAWKKLREELER
jgi:hypothetical protein